MKMFDLTMTHAMRSLQSWIIYIWPVLYLLNSDHAFAGKPRSGTFMKKSWKKEKLAQHPVFVTCDGIRRKRRVKTKWVRKGVAVKKRGSWWIFFNCFLFPVFIQKAKIINFFLKILNIWQTAMSYVYIFFDILKLFQI